MLQRMQWYSNGHYTCLWPSLLRSISLLHPRYAISSLPPALGSPGEAVCSLLRCDVITRVLSTDSFITKLMGYTVNTGILTRYFSFQHAPHWLIFHAVYVHWRQSLLWGPSCGIVYHVSEIPLQCAVMPKNFVFLGVEFLLAKCMTKAFSEDCADQWYHFKYTSTHVSRS